MSKKPRLVPKTTNGPFKSLGPKIFGLLPITNCKTENILTFASDWFLSADQPKIRRIYGKHAADIKKAGTEKQFGQNMMAAMMRIHQCPKKKAETQNITKEFKHELIQKISDMKLKGLLRNYRGSFFL